MSMSTYHVPREFAMGGSYVDETLFGQTRAQKTAAKRRAGQSLVGGKPKPEVLTLTRDQYDAIKRRANAPLRGFEKETRKERATHRVPIKMLAKARPTPEEEYARQHREQVGHGGANIRAFNMRNEELDEIKELRSKLDVMKVKAQVDEGLRLKRMHQQRVEEYEQRKNQEMEELRLKGLRQQAQREAEKRAERVVAQQELVDQVARHNKLQLLEAERLAQEKVQMRLHLEKLDEVERQKKVKARAAAARRALDLAQANKDAKKYRLIEQEQSEAEDRQISEYLQRKAADQEYRLRQAEKLRKEEARNIARMRELQEKHNDKQAEADAKRARQYQEQRLLQLEAEDEKREKARRDMQQNVLQELEHQKQLKARLASQRQQEEEKDSARLRAEAARHHYRQDEEAAHRRQARQQYKNDLLSLIEKREVDRRQTEQLQREEDQRNALQGEVYKHRVKLVMQQKIKEHAQQYPVPARFAPGAEEAVQQRQEAARKFHKTRALW